MLAFSIRSVSCSLRPAIVVTALAVSTRKCVKTGWSSTSSWKKWSVAEVAGREVFDRLAVGATGARELFGEPLDDLLQALSGRRVQRVEQLIEVDALPASPTPAGSCRASARARCSGRVRAGCSDRPRSPATAP